MNDIKEHINHKEIEISTKSNDKKKTEERVICGKLYAYIQVKGRKISHEKKIKRDKIN